MKFIDNTRFRGRLFFPASKSEMLLDWKDTIKEVKIDLREHSDPRGIEYIQNERGFIVIPREEKEKEKA